jgi:hypothetical protein
MRLVLPWFRGKDNQFHAYTLAGRVTIVGRTYPPAYLRVNSKTSGFSVYLKGKRVSWTMGLPEAIGVATQIVEETLNKKRAT